MFLRPNSESYQLSCSTTHSSPSFRLLTMFSIFFTHSARKIPASAAAPRTKRSRKKASSKAAENFQLDKSLFSKRLCSFMVTDLNLSSGGIPSERTNERRSRRRIEAETQPRRGSASTYFEIKPLSMIFKAILLCFLNAIMMRKMR